MTPLTVINSALSMYSCFFTSFVFLKGMKGTPYSQKVVDILYSGGVEGQLEWINRFFNSSYETVKEALNEKKDLIKLNAETGAIGLSLRGFLEIHVINIVAISTVIWTLISYAL